MESTAVKIGPNMFFLEVLLGMAKKMVLIFCLAIEIWKEFYRRSWKTHQSGEQVRPTDTVALGRCLIYNISDNR